jgi:hypothetical protein
MPNRKSDEDKSKPKKHPHKRSSKGIVE